MDLFFITLAEVEPMPTPTQMIDVAERFIRIGTTMPNVYVRKVNGKWQPLHAVDSAIIEAVRRIDPTVKLPVLPVD